MVQRMTRREAWSYFEHVLATAEVAEKGHIACIDLSSGEIVAGQEGTGLLPIGYFEETKTGNGTSTVRVRLFREIWVDRFVNDGDAPVTAAHIGSACYLVDSETVSSDDTGRSIAGRVWGVSSEGVLVQMALDIGLQGPQGEPA